MRFTLLIGTMVFLSSCSVLFSGSRQDTVNGYDKGGLCSQESIEQALNIISQNKGGVLRLKKNGIYHLRPNKQHLFVLPSNIKIEGNGARLIVADGMNTECLTWDAIFYAEGKQNIIIENVTLDANGKNNPVIQGGKQEGAEKHNGLFSAHKSKDITIRNCVVTDVKAGGALYLGYCDNVLIEKCQFYDIGVVHSTEYLGDASVIMGVGNNWVVHNNILRNSYRSNCGTGIDIAFSNSVVRNNVVESFWAGANLANNGLVDCHNVVMEGNEFINNGTAIYLWATIKPFIGSCHDNIIRNNRISWKPGSSWAVKGVDISFFAYGKIYNITVEDNNFYSEYDFSKPTNTYEIAINIGPSEKTYYGDENIGGDVKNIFVINNRIEGCSGPAVLVDRKVDGVEIKNNILTNVSTGNSKYSVNCAIGVTNSTNDEKTGPKGIRISGNTVVARHNNCKQFVFIKKAGVRIDDNNDFITK